MVSYHNSDDDLCLLSLVYKIYNLNKTEEIFWGDVLSTGNECQITNNIFKTRLKLDCKFENMIYLLTINVCCHFYKKTSCMIIDRKMI